MSVRLVAASFIALSSLSTLLFAQDRSTSGKTADLWTSAPSHDERASSLAETEIAPFIDQQFLFAASLNNNAELALSSLAVDNAQDESVAAYAEQMIKDHATLGTRIVETAGFLAANQSGGINPAGSTTLQGVLDPATIVALSGLSQKSGDEFDIDYMRLMVLYHQLAVELFQTERQYGQEESVLDLAEHTVTSLQDHLADAKEILSDLQDSSHTGWEN